MTEYAIPIPNGPRDVADPIRPDSPRGRGAATDPGSSAGVRRIVTILVTLAGLTALVLSPVLKTGYVSDDNTNSLVPGIVKIKGSSLLGCLADVNRETMVQGRFFPLQWAEIWTVFYLIPDLASYKVFVVGTVVLNVLLFFGFVWQVGKSVDFAAFTAALMLVLFQFRAYYDPIISFAGVQQFIFGTFLVSLMTLQRYLETGRWRWLAVSVATYLIALLTYEATYPFFLVHFLLIGHARRGRVERLLTTFPFAGLAAACVLTTVVLRLLYLPDSSAYRVSKDPSALVTTLFWQVTSALPLSYFLADPASLFPDPWRFGALAKFVASATGMLVFAGVLFACERPLRVATSGGERSAPRSSRLMLMLGMALMVLPAALVSVSVRYQKEIGPGNGYIPVYIQYYGVALLASTATWRVLSRASAGARRRRRRARLLAACLVAVVGTVTYQANVRVAGAIATPPGAPGFNPVAGQVLGCYHDHRVNLEAALRAGLVEDVPEDSVVYLGNEYAWWYERHHGPHFFAMHSSRRLRTIPVVDTFYPESPPTRAEVLAAPGPKASFLVRDVCLGATSGYVVLSGTRPTDVSGRSSPACGDEHADLRLFVRHPDLFAYGPTPAVVLLGDAPPSTSPPAGPVGAGEPGFVRRGRDLTIVRSGPDWALVSLRSDAGRVDPGSLRAVLGPVTAEWGDGFQSPEVGPGGWWRWCSRRGVLTLYNPTNVPRKVKISMHLQGKGDAPLVFDGGPLRAEVTPGTTPVRFEREVTLAPGPHRISVSTEASPYASSPRDTRVLYVRMINYKVQTR